MTIKSFDQVWEEGESLFKDQISKEDFEATLKSVELKFSLYRLLGEKKEIPEEDLKQMKFKMMGEILLDMTHLSLIENINVYAALKETVLYRSIDYYAEKHGLET